MSEYLFGEARLATATGVSLQQLTALRKQHLTRGSDWEMSGVFVAYSMNGFDRILAILKIAQNPPSDASLPPDGVDIAALREKTRLASPDVGTPPENPSPEKSAPPLEAILTRFAMNRKMLFATLVDTAKTPIQILVTDRTNYKLGMRVPVAKKTASAQYEVTRKNPRSPGKW